jgi:hypothetical protein
MHKVVEEVQALLRVQEDQAQLILVQVEQVLI